MPPKVRFHKEKSKILNRILIHNLKIRVGESDPDRKALHIATSRLRREGIFPLSVEIAKKSVDARRKDAVCYLYSVSAALESLPNPAKLAKLDAVAVQDQPIPGIDAPLAASAGRERMDAPPVVVGFGPCGMFHALLLAEHGYRPIVLERGDCVRERAKAVETFYRTGILDPNTNIQFGAGGAGTFSDGKLMTRINDPLCAYVLGRLVEFGAPREILIQAKPHIGTDLLLGIVERLADRITDLGGRIYWNRRMSGMRLDSAGRVRAVLTDDGPIECGSLTLAIGHSSRDSYADLLEGGFAIEPKPFSVGVRIEHLQSDINAALYGDFAKDLPPAEYSLSKRIGERGVYSFCMCPGGQVIAAASEEGGVVVNGMSDSRRDGRNANSALAVSVFPSDTGGSPQSAIDFQRSLERAAFRAGGGDYKAPVQTVGDFLSGRFGSEPGRVQPTYMGGDRFTLCDLHAVLPPFVCSMLESGIRDFGRKIDGFDGPDGLLTGVESRTSAPLRILRGQDFTAPGHDNLYPAGEGAGYAGGITSAAVDGLRAALAILSRYGAGKG